MAKIEISNLYATGSELFKDSESFMSDLVDNELGAIEGGIRTVSPTPYSPLCYPTLQSHLCELVFSHPIFTLPPAH